MSNYNLPGFLIVGTAKAGTTSLFNYLKRHPGISIPKKETFYFLRDVLQSDLPYPQNRSKEDIILTREQYQDLYKGIKDQITGEIGTGYLYYHAHVIPRIKETLGPDVKIIMVLRNPAQRAFSSYLHFSKDLFEPHSFKEALEAEEERKRLKWDFMWYHRDLGLYSKQVKAYLQAFDHVKVLFYEDLQKDPKSFMADVFKFIGVAPKNDLDFSKNYNPSGKPRFNFLQKFITHESLVKKMLRPFFRLLFNREKRDFLKKTIKSKNLSNKLEIDVDQMESLKNFYKKDIQELEKILNKDLSHWYN